MKALNGFIKPFKASRRSVKIKTSVNFYFNTIFGNARDEKGEDKTTVNFLKGRNHQQKRPQGIKKVSKALEELRSCDDRLFLDPH